MRQLMENWRGFLSEEELDESLMLKKGKNGWWLYSQLVAEAYRTAPDMSAQLLPLYVQLGEWLEGTYGRISTRIKIKKTPKHIYGSATQLRDKVDKEGVLWVSTSDATHPVWTGRQGLIWNTMFRAWHDWEAHYSHEKKFTLQGEIASYNVHIGDSGVPRACIPIVFTEVVGQICCFYQNGKKNCPQKTTILDDFDFIKVGALTPKGEERFRYTLDPELKLLVPIQADDGDVDVDIVDQ